MSYYSVRNRKQYLESKSKLVTVTEPVDVASTLPKLMKGLKDGVGVIFENVAGFDMPVVSGMFGSRHDWAETLGVEISDITARIREAIAQPIPWEVVPQGACQEHTYDFVENVCDIFPVPKFSKLDSGNFITSAILYVFDPVSREMHISIRRLQVNEDSLSVYIKSLAMFKKFLAAENKGEGLDLAVVIGSHPALMLASQLSSHLYEVDKVSVAGALTGNPVPMVKCQTIDCYVPADSEIVIEGKISPGQRRAEGPFGELADAYGKKTDKPVITINRITSRKDAWFQATHPLSDDDHKLPSALMNEVAIFDAVRRVVPGIKNVHATNPGGGLFHAVISIEKQVEGEGKTAIMAAFGAYSALKHVVIVNDDVDIFDMADVEWSIATRVQADRDVVIISGACGSTLDPCFEVYGTGSKMGIDATYPLAYKKDFQRVSQQNS